MLGWYFDIILDFLIRSISRWIKSYRYRDWRAVETILAGSQVDETPAFGCYKTVLAYTYKLNGELYPGDVSKPFLSLSSAKEYASRFTRGSKITIRADPQRPDKSFVRDQDNP